MTKFLIFLILIAIHVKNSTSTDAHYVNKDFDSAYEWAREEIEHQKGNSPKCITWKTYGTECVKEIVFTIDAENLTGEERFDLCTKIASLHHTDTYLLSLSSKYGGGAGPVSCSYHSHHWITH